MKEKIAGIGALFSALLASACCLGPIVLVGLGLTGAGFSAGFSKYRLFFLALSAILLGTAFYLTYRKREVTCAGGACQKTSASKGSKIFLWVLTALVLGVYVKHFLPITLASKACCLIPQATHEAHHGH